jgi:hypothetical protein
MPQDNEHDATELPTCFFCDLDIEPGQSVTLCIDFGEVHTRCHDNAADRAREAQHEMNVAIGVRR